MSRFFEHIWHGIYGIYPAGLHGVRLFAFAAKTNGGHHHEKAKSIRSSGWFFRIIPLEIRLNGTPPITGRIRSVRRPDAFYPIPVSPGQFERLLPFGTKHRPLASIKELEPYLIAWYAQIIQKCLVVAGIVWLVWIAEWQKIACQPEIVYVVAQHRPDFGGVLSRHMPEPKLQILDDLLALGGLWEPRACDLLFGVGAPTIDGHGLHAVAFGLFPSLFFDLLDPLSAIEDRPSGVGIEAKPIG